MPSGSPEASDKSPHDQPNFEPVFGELDKFCSHILSLPVVAAHPEIKQQLDFILASKEKLKLAQAEDRVHRQTSEDQLLRMQADVAERQEAHRKKMEELETPSPPLNGEALSRALLKSLGLPEGRDDTATLRRQDLAKER
jgi:hypothetical protein